MLGSHLLFSRQDEKEKEGKVRCWAIFEVSFSWDLMGKEGGVQAPHIFHLRLVLSRVSLFS